MHFDGGRHDAAGQANGGHQRPGDRHRSAAVLVDQRTGQRTCVDHHHHCLLSIINSSSRTKGITRVTRKKLGVRAASQVVAFVDENGAPPSNGIVSLKTGKASLETFGLNSLDDTEKAFLIEFLIASILKKVNQVSRLVKYTIKSWFSSSFRELPIEIPFRPY